MSPLRLILVVLLFVGSTIASAQTVYSDKSDYSPGQTAIIAGTGWFNDAQVTIQIDEMPEYDAGHYYTSSVDAEGNWQISFPIEERHLGVRFLVRATGQSSGTVSLTEFTDGSLTISPSTSCGPGGSVVITINTSGLDLTKPISLYKGTPSSGTLLQTFNSGPYTYTINNVQASDAGNYYYKGTKSSNGRSEEGSATLFLNIISSNSISDEEQTICSGESPASITGSIVTASIGSVDYRWFSSDDGINYALINGNAAAAKDYSPGTLTSTKWFKRKVIVSGTDAGNCQTFSIAAKVSVNTLPTGTLSGSTTLCGTQPVILSIAVTGNGPWHGTLSDGTSFSGSTTPILIPVSPTTTTTYTIATLSDSNCNATSLSGSAKIEFGSLPNLTLALATTGTICKGSTVDININGNNDAAGATVVYEVFDGVSTKTNTISLNGGGNETITTEAIHSEVTITLKSISLGACTKDLSASLTVTYEKVAPVATAQDVTVILDVDGNGFTTPELVNNGSSDACGIQSLSLSKTTFSCSDIATNPNEVTLTVVDNSGNVSTTIAYVTVVDATKPIAMAQPVIVQLDADGHGSTTAALVNNGSNDACGIKSMELSKTDFTCADIGDHEVTLTITDNNNNTSSTTAIVTVKDEVAPAAIAQNVTVQLDANGVGSTTAALVNSNSSDACGIKSLALSQTDFTCANVGENTVTLTVTDNNGNIATTTAIVTVKDEVAPVAIAQNVTVYLDAYGKGSTTAALVDNHSSDACGIKSLVLSQTDFTCAHVGSNTVTLTVTDQNNNTATATATATVTVIDDRAPVVNTQDVTVYVGMDGTASITPVQINNGSTDNCAIASYSLNKSVFDCNDVGSNSVTLTVTDVHGNASIGTARVTVVNLAPVINSVTPSSVLFTINTPVTLAINFTDTNVVQATINWDDGSTQAISNPDQVMNIPHTYTAAGVYSIRVKVTDVCGLYQEYLFEYLVAYDPNGGFVTGGGWIESPAGASVQYPDAIGKASFGFVSKYQKGANTPTGNTEFQFKAGNLNFSSTSYQWLVVAGYKAQYKGVGTINGVGSYNFLITAIDGAKISSTSPDKFRIKITNGTAVVYDNQMGVSDDSDASTVLAGGSIVIHDAKSGKRDGVEDATVKSQEIPGNVLSVYPNPVGDVIYVKFTSERDSPIGMQLIDLNGRSLKTETYEVNQTGEYEMSVSNLEMNSGFYLLRIAQDKATKTIKVLKK